MAAHFAHPFMNLWTHPLLFLCCVCSLFQTIHTQFQTIKAPYFFSNINLFCPYIFHVNKICGSAGVCFCGIRHLSSIIQCFFVGFSKGSHFHECMQKRKLKIISTTSRQNPPLVRNPHLWAGPRAKTLPSRLGTPPGQDPPLGWDPSPPGPSPSRPGSPQGGSP